MAYRRTTRENAKKKANRCGAAAFVVQLQLSLRKVHSFFCPMGQYRSMLLNMGSADFICVVKLSLYVGAPTGQHGFRGDQCRFANDASNQCCMCVPIQCPV